MKKYSKILVGIALSFLMTSSVFMSVLIQNNGTKQYVSVDSEGNPVMSATQFIWGQELGSGSPTPSRFFCMINGERHFLSAPQEDGARVMLKKNGDQELWWPFGKKLVLYTYLDLYLKDGEVCVTTLAQKNNAWTVTPSSEAPSTVDLQVQAVAPAPNPPVTTSAPTVNQKAIIQALKGNDIELATTLIKAESDISGYIDDCMRFLVWAYLGMNAKEINKTLSADDQKNLALAFPLMLDLINRGFDVQKIWFFEMIGDTIYSNEKALKFFLQNGANPNLILNITAGTWTPLMRAITCGSHQAVKILVNAGANINQKANPYANTSDIYINKEQTPLTYAINADSPKSMITLLKSLGATE